MSTAGLWALLAAAGAALPAPGALSPRNASYTLEARLDVERRLLTGTGVLEWRNITAHPTQELRLHLYYNAWLNADSSFLRAAARSGRPPDLSEWGPEDWAFCHLRSLRLLTGMGMPSLVLETAFIQPDDGNPHDRTVLQVKLPHPVAPGETVRVAMEWTLKVPRPFARTGVMGDYYLMAHWFPKVGVLEPDGSWNCHQFIQTEFFADFGSYDVTLSVPRGWVVGATGERVSAAAEDEAWERHRFRAHDVHDFAWTASPRFTVHRDRFQSPGLPPVDLELLLLPDHAHLRDRYLEAARHGLLYYGTWFRPYPWTRLTVVDPPSNSEVGGMEYPMFVTGEARWPTLDGNRLAEANTLHEVGHQWFQGAVANDEFEDAWIDEGLNTYAHKRILALVYGPTTYEKRYLHGRLPWRFAGVHTAQPTDGADAYDGFRSPLKREPLGTPAWRGDERIYYLNAYGTGSRLAVTLERHLGWETWRRVLAAFTERFWFRHPGPGDLAAVTREVSGQDLGWFFDQVLQRADVFDYAVDRVVSRRAQGGRGYARPQESAAWSERGEAGEGFDSMVDIRRWGEGVFPVLVRVRFEDGAVVDERWDGRERWRRWHYRTGAPVVSVVVDPESVLVLDVNSANNSWTRRPEKTAAAAKWTARWAVWLQTLLELSAFFA